MSCHRAGQLFRQKSFFFSRFFLFCALWWGCVILSLSQSVFIRIDVLCAQCTFLLMLGPSRFSLLLSGTKVVFTQSHFTILCSFCCSPYTSTTFCFALFMFSQRVLLRWGCFLAQSKYLFIAFIFRSFLPYSDVSFKSYSSPNFIFFIPCFSVCLHLLLLFSKSYAPF